jgi:hypothetical protein
MRRRRLGANGCSAHSREKAQRGVYIRVQGCGRVPAHQDCEVTVWAVAPGDVCDTYGGDDIGWPARRRERVARAGWAREAAKAPSITSALATWIPRDRRSQQSTGDCARSVGGAAGVATTRDVARGRERLAPADSSI